jgi:hypothetical protein
MVLIIDLLLDFYGNFVAHVRIMKIYVVTLETFRRK